MLYELKDRHMCAHLAAKRKMALDWSHSNVNVNTHMAEWLIRLRAELKQDRQAEV